MFLLGKWGEFIRRKGAFFQSVKEACNAEIIIGGAKGPPDKARVCRFQSLTVFTLDGNQ
ncbi:unnamed protein product [Musa acuminata subsp. malaccensis]|uniref:(wild Malaysian banana) hypothetical protein n=1 Tax=Musa acuminata subsp. malaccensis TaxID=214687 RepID=A0A804IGT6_MUSAM|nr:unnamed protein product [Musa acuminata subsp. malaccensis]